MCSSKVVGIFSKWRVVVKLINSRMTSVLQFLYVVVGAMGYVIARGQVYL